MCHVLVIEDEGFIAMMIQDCLIAHGATSVEVAASEADAIACARQHRPDFITSDVRLLEGTGPHAVAAIAKLYGEIPVLFITASPEKCEAYPPVAVMRKPVTCAAVGRRFRMLYH